MIKINLKHTHTKKNSLEKIISLFLKNTTYSMYELIALKWITKLRQKWKKNDEVKWNYLDWHTKKISHN